MTLSELAARLHYPTRLEKLVDGWLHGAFLALFTAAVMTLLGLAIWQGGLGMVGAVVVYALCLLSMVGCSMAYNLTENIKRKSLLRRFDHAAIFLMIAGTYTPFTTLRFEGAWAVGMTTAVWVLALAGAGGKLFLPGLGKKIWVALYVALGWLVMAAMGPLTEGVSFAGVLLLAVGGGLYTVGVPFYIWHALPFRRAIWHGFVFVAAGVHYAAVLTGVVLG